MAMEASVSCRTSSKAARSSFVQNVACGVAATRLIIASASCSNHRARSCTRCACFSAASPKSSLRSSISSRRALFRNVVRGSAATRADIARCSSRCLSTFSRWRFFVAASASSGSVRFASKARKSSRVRVDMSGRVDTRAVMAASSSRWVDANCWKRCAPSSRASRCSRLASSSRALSSFDRWLNEPVEFKLFKRSSPASLRLRTLAACSRCNSRSA
mmetsp:Transcript_66577/g.186059  ORF Transcript_66577/g.186059 Transcript_66577/m.186059 type:complete len:217 (-) Transcript_66577:282-932(-)